MARKKEEAIVTEIIVVAVIVLISVIVGYAIAKASNENE